MKIFNQVQIRKPKRSKFDLSQERKLSMKWGELTPVGLWEIMPGTEFSINTEQLIRLAPMKFPVMHMINSYIHYFYVPNRLVWDEWENFITGGDDGLAAPVFPYLNMADVSTIQAAVGSLWDHMGLPILTQGDASGQKINALPFRAYQMIYNEYYRSQDLIDKVIVNKTDGRVTDPERSSLLTIRIRSYERDYFTSALPEAQKGGEVLLPLDLEAIGSSMVVSAITGTPVTTAGNLTVDASGNVRNPSDTAFPDTRIENDITNASTTINELRNAVRLQEWLEKNARAGSRYIESLLSHFGVRSSDKRLQRPEYLGGTKTPIRISEVLQTYEGTDPLGKMGGHGISVGGSGRIKRYFEEHGYVLAIMSITPKTSYYQGIHRTWLKSTKFDFPFPEFAQLGEQAILNKELYFDPADTTNNELEFGYIPRYSEYKYMPSSVTGQFRTTLANWHLGRTFENRPALNEEFLDSSKTSNDIFNVTDDTEDKFFVQLFHNVKAVLPLPYFGTPTL